MVASKEQRDSGDATQEGGRGGKGGIPTKKVMHRCDGCDDVPEIDSGAYSVHVQAYLYTETSSRQRREKLKTELIGWDGETFCNSP